MSKTWLITGVSSGFGYEMTKKLLEKGDRVTGTVRNRDKVRELMGQYPETFDCRILDVTDVAAVQGTVRDSFEKYKRIDVMSAMQGMDCLAVLRSSAMRKSTISSLQI